jgi:hypothetical protein
MYITFPDHVLAAIFGFAAIVPLAFSGLTAFWLLPTEHRSHHVYHTTNDVPVCKRLRVYLLTRYGTLSH